MTLRSTLLRRLTRSSCSAALLLLALAASPASQAQPETLAEAVAQVRAVTNPDPLAQTKARAREAMAIIQARVDVTNDIPSTCQAILSGGLPADAAVDRARAEGGDTAQAAWDARGGRCNEHAGLVAHLLRGAGERVIMLNSTAGHVFPLVNYAEDYDPDNPWSWGADAFIADTWLANKWGSTGFTGDPAVIWAEPWLFDSGGAYVYSTAGNTTREKLEAFLRRGRAFLERQCGEYTALIAAYRRYPEHVRASFGYTPPTDLCGLGGEPSCPQVAGGWAGELAVVAVDGPTSIRVGQARRVTASTFTMQQDGCDVHLRFLSNEIAGTLASDGTARLTEVVAGALQSVQLSRTENGRLQVVLVQQTPQGATITSEGSLSR